MKSIYGIFIGDCCGSPYEGRKVTGNKIGQYTDDSEQAYGIALWLKSGNHTQGNLKKYLQKVYTGINRGYGNNQAGFLEGKPHRTDSYGNGASMRVAPIGEYCTAYKEVIALATLQSKLTHNHPEAIAGAVTIALLVFLVKNRIDPLKITELYPKALMPESGVKYICSLETIQSVPPAVEAFLGSSSFISTLNRVLSYGGDTDTIAAMACGLAAVKYGIPDKLLQRVVKAHPDNKIMIKKIKKLQ